MQNHDGKRPSQIRETLKEGFVQLGNALFEQPGTKRPRLLVLLYLAALYLFGVYFWGNFFSWGNVKLDFHDWADINMPRFEIVHDALAYQMWPIHAECGGCLHEVTDRFLVLPDVVTTPQMVLLLLVKPATFVLIDILLNYSLAAIGLLLLRKRFRLSLIPFTFLFIAFQLNGYIQAHYAVGHATWAGYFMFPLYFELLLQFLDGEQNWRWVAKLTALSFYTILAGSQHHFTWMMLFTAFLALSYRRGFKWLLAGILFSGFASAIRLLPPVMEIGRFSQKFFSVPGYLTIFDFFTSLVSLRGPDHVFTGWPYDIGYWEFDYYLGLAGTVILLYFGVVRWARDWKTGTIHSALILPTVVLFLLSQSYIYLYTFSRIPMLASERIASRMVSLPVTLVLIAAAVYLNEDLKARNTPLRILVPAALVLVVNDLFIHSELWRIANISKSFLPGVLEFAGNSIINHPDPKYQLVLYAGAALSLGTILILSVLVLNEGKHLKRKT